jgi:hypothetical protein
MASQQKVENEVQANPLVPENVHGANQFFGHFNGKMINIQ